MVESSPMTEDPTTERARRTDLDGLRGVAILLVVCFHVFVGRVSGGVDVFLTLSGWFFGAQLARTVAHGRPPSVLGTSSRLARRLGPALVVVLAATAALVALVQPATWWRPFARQVLASVAQVENWYLALESRDYQAADAAVSPLQHLWTISVQVQVFLGLTLVMLAVTTTARLVRRRRPHERRGAPTWLAPTTYAVLAAASFGYATVVHAADPGWAYYDTLARAWEILLGATAAVVVPTVITARRTPPAWLTRIIGWAGLAAILSCGVLLDGLLLFPGPWTLVPVVATIAIVTVGMSPDGGSASVNRLLAARPAVWLGGRAYSLYLWHWPLLVVLLSWTGWRSVPIWAGACLVTTSVLLAAATTRWVEQPLRPGRVHGRASLPRLRGAVVIGLTGALLAGALGWNAYAGSGGEEALDPASYPGARALTDGWPVPDRPARPDLIRPTNLSLGVGEECRNASARSSEVVSCVFGDAGSERTIALVGGSHSAQWVSALRALAGQHGFALVTYLKQGCRVATGAEVWARPVHATACAAWLPKVLDQLETTGPDVVIAAATRPDRTGSFERPRIGPGDQAPEEFVDVWRTLIAADIEVLGIRDTPWPRDGSGTLHSPPDCLVEGGTPSECGVARSLALDPVSPLEQYRAMPGFHPIDLTDGMCGPDHCPAVVGNVVVYADDNHLHGAFVLTLVPELGRQIGASTGWW